MGRGVAEAALISFSNFFFRFSFNFSASSCIIYVGSFANETKSSILATHANYPGLYALCGLPDTGETLNIHM